VVANKLHGIKAKRPLAFNSIFELQSAIADVLASQGVTIIAGRKTRKLFKSPPDERF
jgi:hypothetical protein